MQRSLYMKILVPVDGSEYSEKALLHACELAKSYNGKLFVMYVVDKSIPLNLLDRKEYLQLLRKYGKKTIQQASEITKKNGIESKQIIKEGSVIKEIVNFAKKENCNLIVVGSKGLGATARFFLGSVSSKLANNSSCSVLIVK